MHEIVPVLEQEIDLLEIELAADPRYLKLRHLKELVVLYRPTPKTQSEDVSHAAVKPQRSSTRRADPERLRMLNEVADYLAIMDGPTKTSALYDYLVSSGFEIGGKEPTNNLSAMLANSGRFTSNGKAGWTLKPDDGPDSAVVEEPEPGPETAELQLSPPEPQPPVLSAEIPRVRRIGGWPTRPEWAVTPTRAEREGETS
jgi:hypothetical protein